VLDGNHLRLGGWGCRGRPLLRHRVHDVGHCGREPRGRCSSGHGASVIWRFPRRGLGPLVEHQPPQPPPMPRVRHLQPALDLTAGGLGEAGNRLELPDGHLGQLGKNLEAVACWVRRAAPSVPRATVAKGIPDTSERACPSGVPAPEGERHSHKRSHRADSPDPEGYRYRWSRGQPVTNTHAR
jgi:hypothetical protein